MPAVDYRAGNLGAQLQAACAGGIDVYFENVGGEILDAVLPQMNTFGRVPVCGLISAYNATEIPAGPRNFRAILTQRLRVQGLIVSDWAARIPEAVEALGGWHREGRLKIREDVRTGGLPAFRRHAQPALYQRQQRQAGLESLMTHMTTAPTTRTLLKPGVTLYFIRHGETDWNAVQRYQGQCDIPLNDKGRGQAARNGRTLGAHLGARAAIIDYVASPLSRASETMTIARREMGLPPNQFRRDDRLKEQSYGHWEGQLWSELPRTDPDGFAAREKDKWNWQPRGGESYRMLSERIAGWLAEVDADCVVASHGAVSRALRGLVVEFENKQAMTALEVPQDKVMVLKSGLIEWL